jgi:hypothetical protein
MAEDTMTLGDLVTSLRAMPAALPVVFAGRWRDRRHPGFFISYRGFYDQLALTRDGAAAPAAGDLLAAALACDGATFHGYKGGEYVMDLDTPLWVANMGEYPGWRVMRVWHDREDGEVVISTATAEC